MKNNVRAFICPHIEEEYTLCQDRFYVDCKNNFFAVSDGVSSSFSPTYYAELVSSYHNEKASISKEDAWIIFSKWNDYINSLLSNGTLGRASKQRFLRGEQPSATYARLKIIKRETMYTWDGAVLGDCAIIHAHRLDDNIFIKHVILSGDKFKEDKYVYTDEDGYYRFGKLPDQLDKDGSFLSAEAQMIGVPIIEGDIFLLCTDGMSDWILNDFSKTIERFNSVLNLRNQEDFLALTKNERASTNGSGRNMENDDITLVIIEINNLQNDILQYDDMYITDIKQLIAIESEEKILRQLEKNDPQEESTLKIINENNPQEVIISSEKVNASCINDRKHREPKKKKKSSKNGLVH